MSISIKILQINATYGDGSTGTIVKDIHEMCLESGMEAYVVYASSSLCEQKIQNGYRIGNVFSNKLHALFTRVNGHQANYSFFPTFALLRHISKVKPDIVHLHNLHSNYIHLGLLLSFLAKRNIPTVVTLHDCWFFTGGCFHYTSSQCYKWIDKCGNCPRKKMDFPAYFLDKSSTVLNERKRFFDKIQDLNIVGCSQWIVSECQKGIFRGRNCVTIYNGIDLSIFKRRDSQLKSILGLEGKYIILGPASKWLDPINKEVFDYVVQNLDESSVLLLYGCPNKLHNMSDKIKTIGFIKDKLELACIYSIADVFVNCSREDTLPTVNLEAQACGLPIVAFANTGSTETINDKCGYKIPTGRADLLMQAINKLKSLHQDEKDAIRESCREWIKVKFEKKNNYQKYLDLYRKIILSK